MHIIYGGRIASDPGPRVLELRCKLTQQVAADGIPSPANALSPSSHDYDE